jgi:hypothetical protein
MSMTPCSALAFDLARPRAAAAWPIAGVESGHVYAASMNTTGTTGSKRFTPGDLIGILT